MFNWLQKSQVIKPNGHFLLPSPPPWMKIFPPLDFKSLGVGGGDGRIKDIYEWKLNFQAHHLPIENTRS